MLESLEDIHPGRVLRLGQSRQLRHPQRNQQQYRKN